MQKLIDIVTCPVLYIAAFAISLPVSPFIIVDILAKI